MYRSLPRVGWSVGGGSLRRLTRTPSSCGPLAIDLFLDGNSGRSSEMSELKRAGFSETFLNFLLTVETPVLLLALPVVDVENALEIVLPEVPLLKGMQTSSYVRIRFPKNGRFSLVSFRIKLPAGLCWAFHPETRTARWWPGTGPGPAGSGRTGSPGRSEQTTGRRLLDR